MDYSILIIPPIAFFICLAVVWALSEAASVLSIGKKEAEGKEDAYACGEVVPSQKAEPEYKTFFPFAIFFTVLHVAGLMAATWANTFTAFNISLAALYLTVIAITLAMLFTD